MEFDKEKGKKDEKVYFKFTCSDFEFIHNFLFC